MNFSIRILGIFAFNEGKLGRSGFAALEIDLQGILPMLAMKSYQHLSVYRHSLKLFRFQFDIFPTGCTGLLENIVYRLPMIVR